MQDVIVVGGGPTGFVTALGLAQAGSTCCLIEAGEAIIDSPRAASITGRCSTGSSASASARKPRRIGYTKDDYLWLVQARPASGSNTTSRCSRASRPFPTTSSSGRTGWPRSACAGSRRCPTREFASATPFTGLTQDADGVTLSRAGEVELRGRWVVGADGAGSAVRKALGLSFDGMTWPERFVATNVRHDFESAGYWQSTMVDRRPLGRGDRQDHPATGCGAALTWRTPRCPRRATSTACPKPTGTCCPDVAATGWTKPRPTRCTSAAPQTFRQGRVMLAGDAAHVTNPTGGFGLTTGLFDAFALWPTLAAVVLDGADPALLDRWAEERRTIFLDKTSPQACAYKRFVFHACGGGASWKRPSKACARWCAIPDCGCSG